MKQNIIIKCKHGKLAQYDKFRLHDVHLLRWYSCIIINNIEVSFVTLNAIEQALMIIGIDNNNIQIKIHMYC